MARRKKGRDISGWLILDKPCGLGSTAAVARVRRYFDAKKIGHAGTLDPMASGILPLALGEATKTIAYMMAADKAYSFTIRWGRQTDSLDAYGKLQSCNEIYPEKQAIEQILPYFTGIQAQMPPAFSALKVHGKRAYDLARAGAPPALAARHITIHDLRLIATTKQRAQFYARCSKGTYIRALARDIAEKLGAIGHVCQLRRLRVGKFNEKHIKRLEKLMVLRHSAPDLAGLDALLLPFDAVLDDIPALMIDEAQADNIRHGRAISLAHISAQPPENASLFRLYYAGKTCALGKVEQFIFRPTRLFNVF